MEDIASDSEIVDVESPMARKTKMGPFYPIKSVDRLNKTDGEVIIQTEFEDNEKIWVPQSFFNEAAKEKYLNSLSDIPDVRYNLDITDM